MAFEASMLGSLSANTPCDICREFNAVPKIYLRDATRDGVNVIIVHEECLMKRIAAAKKRKTKTPS